MNAPLQSRAASDWAGSRDLMLGWAMVAAAVAQAIAGIMHPEETPEGMALTIWGPIHVVLLLAIFVTMLGMLRSYAFIAASSRYLGLAAMVALAFGLAGMLGAMLLEAAVIPVLAGSPEGLSLLDESGPLMGGALGTWLLCIIVLFSVGSIAFGLLLLRAKEVPRWAGPLLIAAPLAAFSPPLPLIVGKIGLVIYSLGVLGLGLALTRTGAQA